MLALVQEAFESGFHWDNFIFIGHESISLSSISYLERLIATYPKGTNFINCWPVRMSTYTTVWKEIFILPTLFTSSPIYLARACASYSPCG